MDSPNMTNSVGEFPHEGHPNYKVDIWTSHTCVTPKTHPVWKSSEIAPDRERVGGSKLGFAFS